MFTIFVNILELSVRYEIALLNRELSPKGYEKLADILSNVALLALANIVIHVFNVDGRATFKVSDIADVILTGAALILSIVFFMLSVILSERADVEQ